MQHAVGFDLSAHFFDFLQNFVGALLFDFENHLLVHKAYGCAVDAVDFFNVVFISAAQFAQSTSIL